MTVKLINLHKSREGTHTKSLKLTPQHCNLMVLSFDSLYETAPCHNILHALLTIGFRRWYAYLSHTIMIIVMVCTKIVANINFVLLTCKVLNHVSFSHQYFGTRALDFQALCFEYACQILPVVSCLVLSYVHEHSCDASE